MPSFDSHENDDNSYDGYSPTVPSPGASLTADDSQAPAAPRANQQNVPGTIQLDIPHERFYNNVIEQDERGLKRWIRESFKELDVRLKDGLGWIHCDLNSIRSRLQKVERIDAFTAVVTHNADARHQNGKIRFLKEHLVYLVELKDDATIAPITVAGFEWRLESLWSLLGTISETPTSGETHKSKERRCEILAKLCKAVNVTGWEHWYLAEEEVDRSDHTDRQPYPTILNAVMAHPHVATERVTSAIGIQWSSLQPQLARQATSLKRIRQDESEDSRDYDAKRLRQLGKAMRSIRSKVATSQASSDKDKHPRRSSHESISWSPERVVKLPMDVLLGRAQGIPSTPSEKPESDKISWDATGTRAALAYLRRDSDGNRISAEPIPQRQLRSSMEDRTGEEEGF
ncbi:Hypothetical protein D9617_44g039060 [Elsinoe fawcettii]|nr:Hypothetical protein D9617_44g039060 [Elsinoe fawcettii]